MNEKGKVTQYLEDNSNLIIGITAITTVTALFLNISSESYTGLREIQFILLLILSFGFLILTFNSLIWLNQKADSYLSGLIVFSLGFLTFGLFKFIIQNFREELNQYMFYILIILLIMSFNVYASLKDKTDLFFDEKIKTLFTRSVMKGFVTFGLVYIWNVFSHTYISFMGNVEIELKTFLAESLFNEVVWYLSIAVAASTYFIDKICFERKCTKRELALGMAITIIVFAAVLLANFNVDIIYRLSLIKL